MMISRWFLSVGLIALAATSMPALAQSDTKTKAGSPVDNLPAHITQLTHFGQRADWSHDGKRILFLEKTYGDVFEVDVATKIIRPITHHYYHEGYTRALYLSDGNILLSGARSFDSEDPGKSREITAELWVLDKSLKHPPQPLGEFCSEGPAVSRTKMRIAWAVRAQNYPDRMVEDSSQIWLADIAYEDGVPKLVGKRKILDTEEMPMEIELETQNFRPGEEKEIIFSGYNYWGGEVMGVNIETGDVKNYSHGIGTYEEPEGIFPDGEYTTVERVTTQEEPFEGLPPLDIWKLKLDDGGTVHQPLPRTWERITYFSEYPGYRGTNPVISDDGRYMAFQLARPVDQAGVGHGLFIFDFSKAPKK